MILRPVSRSPVRPVAGPLLQAFSMGNAELSIRASISGATILDHNGTPFVPVGVNQGTTGENYALDAGNIYALGATVVRIPVIRWWGDTYGAGVDSYSSNAADDYIDPTLLAQGLQDVRWASDAGLWVV